MKKLLFLYDNLMTKEEQLKVNLELEFICAAQINSKMYWMNDGKRRRYFIILPTGQTTNLTYGGIFVLKDYEHNKHKLHSYYNNSIPFTSSTMREDLFDMKKGRVTPIRFDSITSIESNQYLKGESVECSFFVGNPSNSRIQYNSNKYYYRTKGVEVISFLKMVKENSKHE
jgi:hypothetical protein